MHRRGVEIGHLAGRCIEPIKNFQFSFDAGISSIIGCKHERRISYEMQVQEVRLSVGKHCGQAKGLPGVQVVSVQRGTETREGGEAVTEIVKSLTSVELSTLENHEAVIKKGLKSFVDVGNALLAIRDGRLYRESFKTFEDYCLERWGMARNYANKMIAAAGVVGNLGTNVPIPATESQARPLAKLQPEEQAEVWESVTEKAKKEERNVTAKDVEMEVEKRTADPASTCKISASAETYSSETIAGLKRYWGKANKKEKREFLNWIEANK